MNELRQITCFEWASAKGFPVTAAAASEGFGTARHSDEVHVIGHQTVAEQANAPLPGVIGEQLEVAHAIDVGAEHVLAVIAPLSNVVRYAHRHHTRQTRHLGVR